MTTSSLNTGLQADIHALIAREGYIANRIARETDRAQEQARKRATAEQKRDRARARTDARFEHLLKQMVAGVHAIITLAQTPEIQELIRARLANSSYDLLKLYEASTYEPSTKIVVELGTDSIVLSIAGSRLSPVQQFGKLPVHDYCRIVREIPFTDSASVDTVWFRHVFTADLHSHWHEWEYELEYANTRGATIDRYLYRFVRLDAYVLALPETHSAIAKASRDEDNYIIGDFPGIEEKPNMVLLKFLSDCRKPGKLGRYLKLSLQKMQS